MGKGPKEHFLHYSLKTSGLLLVLSGAVSGLTILSYQIYFWLRAGQWLDFPMTYFLEKAGVDLVPVYHPQDWQGVAGVVRVIIETHVGVCLLGVGLLFMMLAVFFQWLADD